MNMQMNFHIDSTFLYVIVAIVCLVFMAVIFYRTLQFKSTPVAPAKDEKILLNEAKIVADM